MSATPPLNRPALAALLLLAACSEAPPPDAVTPDGVSGAVSRASLAVTDGYARAAPTGGVAGVFFRVENAGRGADTLVAARTGAAERVEVHRTTETADGLRGMEEVTGVPVPPGGAVAFEPGGLHVMLVGLRRDLVPGDTVYVDLEFADAPTLVLPARVRGLE